ncbi:helix-turn-helix transcriptional regulator [Nitratireductor sp. StC3]|uniref:helix-turn-helix domain-containing protein n=1 Tax=Nitratireductor sp. StC3 TaxID=2126741 RepID=UPI000D0D8E65|nr:helix-turn-helix transcriptional regulator [Nitratireductor sp. StC3]PSM18518.1 transcriptional regulator [Nitratireductor sp. StC3]
MSTKPSPTVGGLIREWRTRRRMSQLDLALEAEISQRHLSFVESGRATPSRDMVLHLAERLEVPLRARNRILLAAGYAPGFTERRLDDPALGQAMAAVEQVLKGHEPFPAIAVDRHWNLVKANRAIAPFLQAVADPALLEPPVNVLRLSLHPGGLAPRIVNLVAWRDHLLERLRRLNETVADAGLATLEHELRGYPAPARERPERPQPDGPLVAVPLKLKIGENVLSLISTITVFGTPLDISLSELAIESFFPADACSGEILRALAAGWTNGTAS